MTGGRPLGQYSPPNEGLRGSSWAFDAATADADPGAGLFRLNNATQGSATQIFVSDNAESGVDLSSVLATLDSGDSLYIGDTEDPDNYHLFAVTGPAVVAVGYLKIPVVAADSGNDLVDGAPANFSVYQPQGTGGGGGTSFSESWEYKDETTAADPGAGNFRLNNLNPGLATEIYIADESKNGIDFSLLLSALSPGDLVFLQNLETSAEALIATIDAITDNAGWFTLDITVGDNNGAAWTDGKEFGFLFSTTTSGFVDLTSAQTITGLKTFVPFGTGAIGQNDIVIGDPLDYGFAQIGLSEIGRTSFNAGALDLDGSMLFFNQGLPLTSNIEFAFADGTNQIRFALAVPGVGNATYSPRSMLIAGPAALDDEIVTVGYWQAQGIFDNLVCDTSGQGADLGVQNDLEVEGIIYGDEIEESTPDAGITFRANVAAAAAQGTTVFDGESWAISSPRNGLGDSLVIGWLDTGDATTPDQFAIARTSLSGFMFVMPNAPNPQWIIGSNDNSGAVFIDGNGNKDIFFNRLDTGPDRDNRVIFGDGGIGFDDLSSDILEMRAPAAITPGGYRITLPPDAGVVDYVLRTDGNGVTTWVPAQPAALPGVFTETGSTNITTTAATIGLDVEALDPDGNYSIAGGEITVTEGGYFDGSYSIPVNDDGTGGATRGAVQAFIERDQGSGTWIEVPGSRAQDYHREASGGSGVSGGFIAQLADGEAIRLRVLVSTTTDVSSEVGQAALSIHRIRLN